MTQARAEQISLEATPFYHCYVRCVRRAYLCGSDRVRGENFDHRKQWIVSRLRFLSYIYAIDVCAYAVMSNHYHVVLHVDKARAESWTDREVVERWTQLYKGHLLVDRWMDKPESIDKATLAVVEGLIATWRERLYGIDWFMRCVNECIARMANEEENCKGRFWEGRYKSQALLDEGALLSCMAYVDLNPVRAAIADNLSDSDFTSIQQRLFSYVKENKKHNKVVRERVTKQENIKKALKLDDLPQAELMLFDGSARTELSTALPFTLEDYFDLVDTTGRIVRSDKRGAISEKSQTLLHQFNINPDQWIDHIQKFSLAYANCVGSKENILDFSQRFERRWSKGVKQSSSIYKNSA